MDAAEQLLKEGGTTALTAGAVAERVGLARNSLYRYVESIDDLRGRVVMRHLPTYLEHVRSAVAAASTPEEGLFAYVDTNLRIVDIDSHGWMMELAQGLAPETEARIASVHAELVDALTSVLAPFEPTNPRLSGELIHGIILAGFTALEHGNDLEQTIDYCYRAALVLASG